jgi:hypothetical protein
MKPLPQNVLYYLFDNRRNGLAVFQREGQRNSEITRGTIATLNVRERTVA